jgi:spermidine synthase
MDLRFALLLVCFFVSGFAALLYQTAWTREFAFLFGTSELAVVAVLAAYMAGLALGAAAAARFVGRLTRPVLTYGVLELAIAIGALLVPFGIRLVQGIYLALAGGLDAPPETMALTTALFHLVGSFVVLVPCTALMGATLPLLARYAVHEDAQVGPRVGVLYAVNTFGAIAGTLVAAFLLLPELGLRQTVYVGIAGNVIVFLAAAALAAGLKGVHAEGPHAPDAGRFHWILPAMTVSGAVSFIYEVLWTRLLGHVLGGSTAAFASMLASFLLGIALGSALAARFATTREAAARGFALAQLGIGALAFVAFRVTDWLPDLARAVGASPSSPAPGAAAAGAVLLPVTLCIGATFPFGVRLLTRDADEAARVSGRVYAWNTVGSIIGAILAGFFFLPLLGLQNTAMVGVVASLILAIVASWLALPRRQWLAAGALATLLVFSLLRLPVPERLLLNSAMTGQPMPGEIFYLGVGRSATVTVVEGSKGWRLLTNGLPESGVDRVEVPDLRFNETAWLSLLPTAARPETDKMLIIGLGGGQTLGAVAQSVSEIDVIELEDEVVIANRRIPRPVEPLDDPRVSLRLGDARGAMTLSDARYDAIVSQPSHPWTSGASHLYTHEFFELAHSKLEPGGIFVQWIGASFVDGELFGSLMASMTDVFEYVHVYRPVPPALVFVASDAPIDLARSVPRALAATPEDFGRYGIHRVEDFYASWSLDTAGVRVLSASSPMNTDDHNRLATRRLPPTNAERRFSSPESVDALFARQEVLDASRLAQVEPTAVIRRMGWTGETRRARQLARSLPTAQSAASLGWILYDTGQPRAALGQFERAFAADPELASARTGLVATGAVERLDLAQESAALRALAEAGRRGAAGDRQGGLRALDAELAEFGPGDLGFAGAARIRIESRLATGDPADAAEAIEIVDRLLSRQRTPQHYLLRARAAAAMGDRPAAWAALDTIAKRPAARMRLLQQAVALANELGDPPPGSNTLALLNRARRAPR